MSSSTSEDLIAGVSPSVAAGPRGSAICVGPSTEGGGSAGGRNTHHSTSASQAAASAARSGTGTAKKVVSAAWRSQFARTWYE